MAVRASLAALVTVAACATSRAPPPPPVALLDAPAPATPRLGIVCAGQSFCPFRVDEPLVPAPLAEAVAERSPLFAAALPSLTQLEDALNKLLDDGHALLAADRYALVRVGADAPLPTDLTAIILVGPSAPLGDALRALLHAFVAGGGTLVVLEDAWTVPARPVGDPAIDALGASTGDDPALTRNATDLDALLADYGVVPSGGLVLEPTRHGALALGPDGATREPEPMLPTFTGLDPAEPILGGTTRLTLPFSTWYTLAPRPGVRSRAVVRSSAEARGVADPGVARAALDLEADAPPPQGPFTVVALAELEPGPAGARGRVLVVGSNFGLEPISRETIFSGFDLGTFVDQPIELLRALSGWGARLRRWMTAVDQLRPILNEDVPFLQRVLAWAVVR